MNHSELNYRPSLLGRVSRRTLPVLRMIMPVGAYNKVYRALYGAYTSSLRMSYRLHVWRDALFGDAERRLRSELTLGLLPYTMGGRRALENAFDTVLKAERQHIPGAIVECGVARGGTAAMMALTNTRLGDVRRAKWFFDSYEGLPEPTNDDYEQGATGEHIRPLAKGSCLGTIEQVSGLMFDTLRIDRSDCTLVKGWFQDTIPLTKGRIGAIAVLRLDGDWYESTKIPLEQMYAQVSSGGFVIVDDYGTCYGARRALDEFLRERSIQTELHPDGRGGAWFQKPR